MWLLIISALSYAAAAALEACGALLCGFLVQLFNTGSCLNQVAHLLVLEADSAIGGIIRCSRGRLLLALCRRFRAGFWW